MQATTIFDLPYEIILYMGSWLHPVEQTVMKFYVCGSLYDMLPYEHVKGMIEQAAFAENTALYKWAKAGMPKAQVDYDMVLAGLIARNKLAFFSYVLDDSRRLHYEVNKSYSAAIQSDNVRAMTMMRRRGRVPVSREVAYACIGTGNIERMSMFLKEYRRHQYMDCLREARAKKQPEMVTFMEATKHDKQMWTEF